MSETTTESIAVSSIRLNPKNFRHRPVESQEESFAALLADQKDRDYLFALATDIAGRGLDPSSLLIVEPVGKHWKVLEGNRRLASLKAMANPDVIPDLSDLTERQMKAYRDKFAKLGTIATLPSDLLCVVTTDKELSDHWITLKHTGVGQHKGAGTVEWDAVGRGRHEQALGSSSGATPTRRRASSEQTDRALALLDALRVQFAGDSELLSQIDRAEKRGTTTLGRLLIRPENQLRLGVEIDDTSGQVRFAVTPDSLRSGILRMLTDLGTPRLNSRSINTQDDVGDYLDRVEEDLPRADDRTATPQPPSAPRGGVTPTGGATGSSTASAARPAPKREKRPSAKPYRGLKLRTARPKTKTVLEEMQALRFDTHSTTCIILNRVLIDLFCADVIEELGAKSSNTLATNLRTCLRLIDTDENVPLKRRKYTAIWNSLDTGTGELSVDSMHLYLHRAAAHGTEQAARVQCENYEPVLAALDARLEAHRAGT